MKAKSKKRKYWFQGTPFLVSGLLVVLLVVLYGLTRLSLWIFNPGLFAWEGFGSLIAIVFGGLRFDLAAVMMVNLPVLLLLNLPFPFRQSAWYRVITALLFVAGNFLAILSNLVDVIYFRFTAKRMTGDFFNYLKAGGDDAVQLMPQYIRDFWYLALILLLILVFLVLAWKKLRYEVHPPASAMAWARDVLLFLAAAFVTVVGVRGGFQLKPIHLMAAAQYASQQNIPLALNTPFSMIKTWDQKEIREVRYFPDEASLERIYSPVHRQSSFPPRKMNVVVIILESFSSEFSAYLNQKEGVPQAKGYMPFLDSLMEVSLSYKGFANGKRSIEAIPAILAGVPSWMNNDYITSSFAGNSINTLPSLLRPLGYRSAFFHGGNNGTMNFDDFARIAGFDRYYGRNEYGDDRDYDGKWGIFDEPFFRFSGEKLSQMPQPFLGVIFSLSSHHPYTLPPQHKGRFPAGRPEITGSIAYADYALRSFFRQVSRQSWFGNTLFVITADHTPEAWQDYYKTRVGAYSVPILFYHRDLGENHRRHRVVQQTDIMPSVLDFLGFSRPFLAFGTSVFSFDDKDFALSFLNGSYLLIRNHYAMVRTGDEVTGFFDMEKDPMQKINLVGKEDAAQKESETFLKAVIQQYNNRMVHNRLTVYE